MTARIPSSTYRLQFSRDFTFSDARDLVGYLDSLGITDCYASPIFRASAGSSHGYDICDHARLNPELGSDADFEAWSRALRDRDMGLILDQVPNHMGIRDAANGWWLDVLENGPSSPYASYFDIDWHPLKGELENKVLLPILEDQYGKVLESGKFRLIYREGSFVIEYHETVLPVAPRTYIPILADRITSLKERLGSGHVHVVELESVITALGYLPMRTEVSRRKIEERHREKEVIKRRLQSLVSSSPDVAGAIEGTLIDYNGTVGDAASFDALDRLIESQAYRPAFWRVATEEINYRRFFDINELAAIRVERSEVFTETHGLLFRLLAEGKATGLRIDHPDGLWDPPAYFRRLQQEYRRRAPLPDAGNAEESLPLYVVVEKILAEEESLPQDWLVHGTTGYDFLGDVNGIFVDGSHHRIFRRIYGQFTKHSLDFDELVNSTKKMIMLISLAGEINALTHWLDRISEKNRRYRDFTLVSLTFAIREIIACLPVYRTYTSRLQPPSDRDAGFIESAVLEARQRNPRAPGAVFDFIRDTLLLRNLPDFSAEDRDGITDFVMKFQQITGPVMAKAVEDTAFYRYNLLVSLNEVGADPTSFGLPVARFHERNAHRHELWPHTMLCTSTHDTKRSEDARARLHVLSELPEEWKAAVGRWGRMNARHKTLVAGARAPDRNDEYLLYQTLLAVWPAQTMAGDVLIDFRERIVQYMLKAIREAKVHTSWVNPNEAYDDAASRFVRGILSEEGGRTFLDDVQPFQEKVRFFGWINSLSQTLLKLTAPGVPDIYQGTELWDLSLVDPDNRRPVDYDLRRQLLEDLEARRRASGRGAVLTRHLLDTLETGQVKLYVTQRTLDLRRRLHRLFCLGDYVPVEAKGVKGEHVCAFLRRYEQEQVMVVVPRLVVGLTHGTKHWPMGERVWEDTRLLAGGFASRMKNLFTGESLVIEHDLDKLPIARILDAFPVALLHGTADT